MEMKRLRFSNFRNPGCEFREFAKSFPFREISSLCLRRYEPEGTVYDAPYPRLQRHWSGLTGSVPKTGPSNSSAVAAIGVVLVISSVPKKFEVRLGNSWLTKNEVCPCAGTVRVAAGRAGA